MCVCACVCVRVLPFQTPAPLSATQFKAAAFVRPMGEAESIPARAVGGMPYPGQQAPKTSSDGKPLEVQEQSFFSRYVRVLGLLRAGCGGLSLTVAAAVNFVRSATSSSLWR